MVGGGEGYWREIDKKNEKKEWMKMKLHYEKIEKLGEESYEVTVSIYGTNLIFRQPVPVPVWKSQTQLDRPVYRQ